MHIQISPGKSKDWGPYVLTATRYNLTDNINGRLYLDYRDRLGLAGGFGANLNSKNFGQADFKFYHTQERPKRLSEAERDEYERYLLRLRYKWTISSRTSLISELHKVKDEKRKSLGNEHDFLKDYFYREYEKDTQPLSYILLHHNFNSAGLDLLFQKRLNRWYDYVEKLPQLRYTLPSYKLGQSPFYFSNITDLSHLDKKDPLNNTDITSTRLDIYNNLVFPFKFYIFNLSPFVGIRNTLYDKDNQDDELPLRNVFYTGLDISTKFYRTFDTKTNLLGLDINKLRHIITPSLKYTYNHKPTLSSRKIRQIDSVDAIAEDNRIKLELTNKLQTKRKDTTTDLLTLRLDTDYIFSSKKPLTEEKTKEKFSELNIDLELFPYSWLRIDS
ncbi:MAG: hypothetical protein N2Z79_00305, partial [Candidatus Omnitrophica bacterium]|nr:hypothetical protein [Candidatus Omnitrophota bacterium]